MAFPAHGTYSMQRGGAYQSVSHHFTTSANPSNVVAHQHHEPNPPSLPQPDYNVLRGLGRAGLVPPPFAEPAKEPTPAGSLALGPVEAAFQWPETSRSKLAYDAKDPRHIWHFSNDAHGRPNCPVPTHAPKEPAAPVVPAPPPEPPIAVIDRAAGTVTWPATGNVYSGGMGPFGAPEGKGTLVYAASGDTYVGSFLHGERHGPGAYHHGASGSVTVGNCLRDRPVGTSIVWSADRRKAWCLLDGSPDMAYKRVAPVDPTTVHVKGLEWHPTDHGCIPLGAAYRLACANGLAAIAKAIGAPSADPINETAFHPGAPNFLAPGRYVPRRAAHAARPAFALSLVTMVKRSCACETPQAIHAVTAAGCVHGWWLPSNRPPTRAGRRVALASGPRCATVRERASRARPRRAIGFCQPSARSGRSGGASSSWTHASRERRPRGAAHVDSGRHGAVEERDAKAARGLHRCRRRRRECGGLGRAAPRADAARAIRNPPSIVACSGP